MKVLQFPAKELTPRQQTIVNLHNISDVNLTRLSYLYERENDFELVAIIDALLLKGDVEFDPANTLKLVKGVRKTILGGE